MSSLVFAAYLSLGLFCALLSAHRALLTLSWLRVRNRLPRQHDVGTPVVTVQLPLFNERDVVARLVGAVGRLDWPSDRLQIQLLDDSTDDTGQRAAAAIVEAQSRGIEVQVIRRSDRSGFKAGALANGLRSARGEVIAIFDADFVPAPDFLRSLVPYLGPRVGMVQARWAHLNAGHSLLTRAEAALLDGHFVIEHTARSRGGAWFNFNGTAGVWRREAIDAAGGWQADTLTEDLDLSYRAQLAGWTFVYRLEYGVLGEIPESLAAFREQQRRWAKGSIQVARKLLGRILTSDAPLRTRIEACAHLTANVGWFGAFGVSVLLPSLALTGALGSGTVLGVAFGFSMAVHALFYGFSAGWRGVLPALVLGVGMTVNQVAAVLEGLAGQRSPFVRTPKSGGGSGSYRPAVARVATVECALAALQLIAALRLIEAGNWAPVPGFLLLAAGFCFVGAESVKEWRMGLPGTRFDADSIYPAPAGRG